MKRITVLICMIITTLGSFAQYEDDWSESDNNNSYSAGNHSKKYSHKRKHHDGIVAWHYVEAGYEYNHMKNDMGGYDRNFNMGNFGYHIAFNTFSATPNLKVETGLNFAFGTSKNVQYNVVNKPLHVDYNVSYLKLPIAAAYELKLNDNIDIVPTAGFYAKVYLNAKSKSYSDDKDVEKAYKYFGMSFGETNHFNQSTSDWNWKRFGCGLQAGINVVVANHILAGVQYSYELTKIDPEFGYNFTHNVNVKVGWVF